MIQHNLKSSPASVLAEDQSSNLSFLPFINKKCNLYICSSELIRFCTWLKLCKYSTVQWKSVLWFKCVLQHTRNVHWDRGLINTRNLECHFPEWLAFEILVWILFVILSCILYRSQIAITLIKTSTLP